MCGRFTLTLEVSALQLAFDLGAQTVAWNPNYNITPTMKIPVVTDHNPGVIELFQWGLIPSWAKDPSISAKLINARSETAHEKPSFRNSFRAKRCLVLADGFYEWQKGSTSSAKKTPYYFHKPNQEPFLFAGLWDAWPGNKQNQAVNSCTILTCSPNAIVSPIHDRMPVIFDWVQGKKWLNAGQSIESLQEMLTPIADNDLVGYEVSPLVNRPVNNSPMCIEPVRNSRLF